MTARTFRIAALAIGFGLIAILFVATFVAEPAKSHEAPMGWDYDQWCCNGDGHSGDCQQIPSKSVRIVPGGYQVTLGPGDHRLVTVPHIWIRGALETRPSQDGEYHACLYPDEATLRCLYVPPLGF